MTIEADLPNDIIQIHYLTAYPASCIVRGDDGRPKTMVFGGVERARLSSASVKRAVRTSDVFVDRFQGHLGTRTRRIGDLIVQRLSGSGYSEAAIEASVDRLMDRVLDQLGSRDEKKPGWIKQLAFISEGEIAAMVELARGDLDGSRPILPLAAAVLAAVDEDAQPKGGKKAKPETKKPKKGEAEYMEPVLNRVTNSVDIALFGRFYADSKQNTVPASMHVGHTFTVDRAVQEADFYVAVDDHAQAEDDTAGGFLGESFFTSGLFYGYVTIDMRQLRENLGGDAALASSAAAAAIEGLLTVTPRGKVASFATHAMASWAMVRRGKDMPCSCAAAVMSPVAGNDLLNQAITRLEGMSSAMDRAYGQVWDQRVMNVFHGQGSLAELIELAA